MKEVEAREVIITTLTRRGKGDDLSPIRCITQVFEKDGTLIAENDPSPETFAAMDLVYFTNWFNDKAPNGIPTINHVKEWLKSIKK